MDRVITEGVYLVYSSHDKRSQSLVDAFKAKHGEDNLIDLFEESECINFYTNRITRAPSIVFVNSKKEYLYSIILDIPQAINKYLGL